MKYLIGLLILMSFVACKKDSSKGVQEPKRIVEEIKDSLLDGKIANGDWAFISGRVRPNYFDSNSYSLDLWEFNSEDPCNEFGNFDARKIIGIIPKSSGRFEFGNERNVTFSFNQDGTSVNYIATEGELVITNIDSEYLEGKMLARFDSENYVNGKFKVKVFS